MFYSALVNIVSKLDTLNICVHSSLKLCTHIFSGVRSLEKFGSKIVGEFTVFEHFVWKYLVNECINQKVIDYKYKVKWF